MIKTLAWKLLAQALAIRPVASAIIWKAKRTPYVHLSGYMKRYWFFNPYQHADGQYVKQGWLRRRLPSIRVHCILREDRDLHLHDHPWEARTIILRGGYTEQTTTHDWTWRLAGDTVPIRHGRYHRIAYVAADECDEGVYTLFFTWEYVGTWGFLVDGKKVPHREYLGVDK